MDDMSQRTFGVRRITRNRLAGAMLATCRGLRDMFFTVSDKSVVTGTFTSDAVAVARLLAGHAFPVSAVDSAADLGVDSSGGRVLAARPIERKRHAKGRTTATRCRTLGAASRLHFLAGKLMRVAGVPRHAYGHEIYGTAPKPLAKLRADIASTAACSTSGRRTSTLIAIAGDSPDPGIRFPCDTVAMYLRYWIAHPDMRMLVVRAWRAAFWWIAATPTKKRWSIQAGPLTGVINTLLDAKWVPFEANHWDCAPTYVNGVRAPWAWKWPLEGGIDISGLLRDLSASLELSIWKKAALFRYGSGLEGGVDMASLRAP